MSNRVYKVRPGEPAEIDIQHYRNDTYTDDITGFNADGTPYDFTNHTFIMQIRRKKDSTDTPDVDITNASFTITQDADGVNAGVNNVVEISHTEDDFDLVGDFFYDIQMTDAAGKRQTIQKGIFCIEQDVSR